MSDRVARLVSVKGVSIRVVYQSMSVPNQGEEPKNHLSNFYRVEAISIETSKPLFIGFLMERGGNTFEISNGHGLVHLPTAPPLFIEQDHALEAMIAHAQDAIRQMAMLMGCRD